MKNLSWPSLRIMWISSALFLALAFSLITLQPIAATADQQAIPPKAKDILLAANNACLQLKTATYDFEGDRFNGSQSIVNNKYHVIQSWGAVPNKRADGKYFAMGTNTVTGRSARPFAVSYDGSTLRYLDHVTQSIFVFKPPMEQMLETLGGDSKSNFFTVPPFKKIFDTGDKLEYQGTGEIDGILCYIVAVTHIYGAGDFQIPATAKWYFGAKDYLPRRYESSSQRSTVHNLKINSAIDESEFIVKAPDGYIERIATDKPADTLGLLAVDSVAPNWTLQDAAGQNLSLSNYRGKIVLIHFWGTWCLPCLPAMPHLQTLYEAYKDKGVVVIGLAVPDREGSAAGYMKEHQFRYGLLKNADEVAKLYKVSVFPTLYVIGPDGQILHVEAGGSENMESEVRALIEKTLETPKP